jgi:hypothetical protein
MRLTGAPPVNTCALPGNGVGVPPSVVPAIPLPPNPFQSPPGVVPEASLAVLIPFLGLAIAGGLAWRRHRQQARRHNTTP